MQMVPKQNRLRVTVFEKDITPKAVLKITAHTAKVVKSKEKKSSRERINRLQGTGADLFSFKFCVFWNKRKEGLPIQGFTYPLMRRRE